MNVQIKSSLARRMADATPSKTIAFAPRLVDEVVAGLLWMTLDLPDDVSRQEVELLAHEWVLRIRATNDQAMLERTLALLQLKWFSRPANILSVRDAVRRTTSVVSGF